MTHYCARCKTPNTEKKLVAHYVIDADGTNDVRYCKMCEDDFFADCWRDAPSTYPNRRLIGEGTK